MITLPSSDLAELLSLMLTALAVIVVVFPLCGAFADAVAFARFPAHRVTPASPWVFFDRRFHSRLRRWIVGWILAAPVTGILIALLLIAQRYSRVNAFYMGVQGAAFTMTAALLAATVVFLLAPRKPGIAFTIPAVFILTAALFAGIIIVGGFPPPATMRYIMTGPDSYSPSVGMEYVYTLLAVTPIAGGAIPGFYLFRSRLRLLREESEGLREGREAK